MSLILFIFPVEPDSYKNPPGPLLNPIILKNETAKWAYIRVPGIQTRNSYTNTHTNKQKHATSHFAGIGILPGLACPHYDMVGSNGVHRAVDFTGTMQHHSGENAIGVGAVTQSICFKNVSVFHLQTTGLPLSSTVTPTM
jgi:dipeptidase E